MKSWQLFLYRGVEGAIEEGKAERTCKWYSSKTRTVKVANSRIVNERITTWKNELVGILLYRGLLSSPISLGLAIISCLLFRLIVRLDSWYGSC